MPDANAEISRLFGSPGARLATTAELRRRAAAAHHELLRRAAAHDAAEQRASLRTILALLDSSASPHRKRRLLCHPLLIEGLHALADGCSPLRTWHDAVAPPAPHSGPRPSGRAASLRLGNVAFALMLHAQPNWRGELDLSTDALGRIGFPFSDWSVRLQRQGADECSLGNGIVRISLDEREASWRIDGDDAPFLSMARDDCVRTIARNHDDLPLSRVRFPNPNIRVRLQFSRRFGRSRIRYDPVGFRDFKTHAGMTGGLLEALLLAMRRNAPGGYHELCAFIHSIRGFELPDTPRGVVESFSDPTLPGVMGVNICYSAEHEPCLNPLFFMNLGHELGHTKHYLIDTVLHVAGEALMRNSADNTGIVPRYGRALSMRTVLQIPYVHLYEWALLMDFAEAKFEHLPWHVDSDWVAAGDDVAAEIAEAFDMIDAHAHLTPRGQQALAHLRWLYDSAMSRWRGLT